MPMKVHHCDNKDVVRTNSVEYAVWKPMDNMTADIISNHAECLGSDPNA
jgi:hypothetical protein